MGWRLTKKERKLIYNNIPAMVLFLFGNIVCSSFTPIYKTKCDCHHQLVCIRSERRRRMGPLYGSSVSNTFPFCITSSLPSRTSALAASRVGSINSLQFCFRIRRGISLGQHVFPLSRVLRSFKIFSFNSTFILPPPPQSLISVLCDEVDD